MGKIAKLKKINQLANEGIRQKFSQAKEDKRHFALIMVELLLLCMIVVSLVFLFDPALAFPQAQFIPWPLKLLLFVGAVLLCLKLYDYTKEFRVTGFKVGDKK